MLVFFWSVAVLAVSECDASVYILLLQRHYEENEDTEEGPVEVALKEFLIAAENQNKQMRNSVVSLLESDTHKLSSTEANLRRQLEQTVRFSETKGFVLKRPKTIKAFIRGDYDETQEKIAEKKRKPKCCCALSCLFGFCAIDETHFCLEN